MKTLTSLAATLMLLCATVSADTAMAQVMSDTEVEVLRVEAVTLMARYETLSSNRPALEAAKDWPTYCLQLKEGQGIVTRLKAILAAVVPTAQAQGASAETLKAGEDGLNRLLDNDTALYAKNCASAT